jgi:ABC-type transporter Mla MlaB component
LVFGLTDPANSPEPPVLTQTYQPDAPLQPAPQHDVLNAPALQAELDLDLPQWPSSQPAIPAPEPPPAQSAAPASSPAAPRRASVYENALEGHLEVVTLRQDSEIEEAAINLASGDEAAAESTLLKLISASGTRREDVEVWLALFDLYRVTGNCDAFNDLAPEFVTLFGRSAPQWERALGRTPAARQNTARQAVARAGTFTWASPAQFNARALTALTSAIDRSTPPWRIDWRAIKTLEPDVLPPLGGLLTRWADTPVSVQFLGGERLLAVLTEQSPTEDKNVNPAWWRVRLSLLRLMNAPELFDQTALDYCITYEISPPAWMPPKGSYTPLRADGQPEAAPADEATNASPLFAPTVIPIEPPDTTEVFEAVLEGDILDSADPVLAALPTHLEHIRAFEFNCRALRRVDFGAAGELLNWSIQQQGQGRTVTFRDVHRLLAAFFSVIGINAAAQVVWRKD